MRCALCLRDRAHDPVAFRLSRDGSDDLLRQDHGSERRLLEVELAREVPEDRGVLAHVGPRIGALVRLRVEPLPAEEVVLDELEVRVETQRLMVDVPLLRVRADHETRHTQAVAVLVGFRRSNVVVEAAPVVPGQEDRRRAPVRPLHDRVDQTGHVVLAHADARGRVLAHRVRRRDPRDGRKRPVLRSSVEVARWAGCSSAGRPAARCRSTGAGSRCRGSARFAARPCRSPCRRRSRVACPGRRSSPS